MYINQIHNFFKQINKKKDYKKLILDHNIKMFYLIVKADLNMFLFSKTFI